MRRAFHCGSDDAFEARIFEAFDQLSIASYAGSQRPPEASLRMQYVKRFIESHFADQLRLDDIASHVHLSPFALIRQFKSAVKTTPHAYLATCRLNEARRLLADASLGVSEIAQRVGLFDANYFARCFRRASGVSPTEYRLTRLAIQRPGPMRCNSATNAGFHVVQPSLEYCISK